MKAHQARRPKVEHGGLDSDKSKGPYNVEADKSRHEHVRYKGPDGTLVSRVLTVARKERSVPRLSYHADATAFGQIVDQRRLRVTRERKKNKVRAMSRRKNRP